MSQWPRPAKHRHTEKDTAGGTVGQISRTRPFLLPAFTLQYTYTNLQQHQVMAPTEVEADITNAVLAFAEKLHSTYVHLQVSECASLTHRRPPLRLLFPTDTYAAGVWQPGDDIRLVCMTGDSVKTFWQIVAEALDLDALDIPENAIYELSSRKLEIPESILKGGKIYLHRCTIPEDFDMASVPGYGIPGYEDARQRKYHEVEYLSMIRDTEAMLSRREGSIQSSEDWETFKQAYLQLRGWTEANGLLAAQFGMLSAEVLLFFVHRTLLLWLNLERREANSSYREVLLEYCAASSQEQERMLGVAHMMSDGRLVVPTRSRVDIAGHVTLEGSRALQGVASHVRDTAHQQQCTVNSLIVDCTPTKGYNTFVGMTQCFVAVDIECWGYHGQSRRELLDIQLPGLLKAIASRVHGRLWPYPVSGSLSDGNHATYVVGIQESHSPGKVRNMLGKLEQELDYERSEAVMKLCPYSRDEYVASFSYAANQSTLSTNSPPSDDSEYTSANKPTSKFRAAGDAISRLRHDPKHAATEYEVGYLDRFEGVMWLRLEDWGGKATEDEEFIPEHRVRQLRRVNDGEVVWDRERRVDIT